MENRGCFFKKSLFIPNFVVKSRRSIYTEICLGRDWIQIYKLWAYKIRNIKGRHSTSYNESNTFTSNLFDVDILLTRGIGNGLIQKLAGQNVACYKIEEADPDTAIEKLIKGTLEAVAPVSHEKSGCNCNCRGKHGHNH